MRAGPALLGPALTTFVSDPPQGASGPWGEVAQGRKPRVLPMSRQVPQGQGSEDQVDGEP